MRHLFDLRTIFLAKHAQHIVIIHFPIALYCMSVVFDLLSVWRQNRMLSTAAYYNLIAAAIASVFAVVTGLMAWQLIYEGSTPRGVLLYHLISAGITTCCLWTLMISRYRANKIGVLVPRRLYVVLTFLTLLGILVTAHLGGIVSGLVTIAE